MTQLGQAQVGHKGSAALRSTPKLTRINGDDNLKVIWKNMGNNHAYPLIWGQEFTVASGVTAMTLVSGVKFHGMELASYANVQVTPGYDAGDCHVSKDTVTNKISLTVEKAGANDGSSRVDAKFMLGNDDPVIEGIYCSTWSKDNIRSNFP
jgi:hypothetical protein